MAIVRQPQPLDNVQAVAKVLVLQLLDELVAPVTDAVGWPSFACLVALLCTDRDAHVLVGLKQRINLRDSREILLRPTTNHSGCPLTRTLLITAELERAKQKQAPKGLRMVGRGVRATAADKPRLVR